MATANLSDFKCNRCGDGHRLPKATVIAGEYHTSLCSPCLNAWAVDVRNTAEWAVYQAAKASPEVLLALMCGGWYHPSNGGSESRAQQGAPASYRQDYYNALLALDNATLAMHERARAWVMAGVPNA